MRNSDGRGSDKLNLYAMHFLFFSIIGLIILPEQIVNAQASIAVRNDYAPEIIREQAAYYAEQFSFEDNVYILITFSHQVPGKVNGFTRYEDARALGGGHQVHITINRKAGRSHQLHTLAHEMVHARQFVEGKLVQCSHQHFSWEEKICLDIRDIDYHARPWEKEAETVGAQLYDCYRKQSLAVVRRNAL